MGGVGHMMRGVADGRRRLVLAHVSNAESEWVAFDDLVDAVVEAETNSPAPEREAVAISLYHKHLPKLAESGLIEHEADRGGVTATNRTPIAESFLEAINRGR